MISTPRIAVLLVALAPIAAAEASNANLPRTPVIHTGEACITVVDRSVDPDVELTYTVPFPDTCLGDDDVPGSRTQQFLAFCRGVDPSESLPQWTRHADVDLAAEHDLLPEPLPEPEDVLDLADAWEGCFVRIVPDDMRRPIHCDDASAPVVWDTTEVLVGAWVVHGYTFDPPTNLWRPRRGVFKVVDGGEDPPAVALEAHPVQVGSDNTLPVRVCVDAAAGATVTASWSRLDAPSWQVFDVRDVDDGTYELAFTPPPTSAAIQVMLAVEIEDPEGRRFRYASPDLVTVIPGDHPPPPPGPIYDFCAEHEDAFEPQNCTAGSDDGDDDVTKTGCGCTSATPGNPAALAFLLALACVRDRCRRGRDPRSTPRGSSRSAARRSRPD